MNIIFHISKTCSETGSGAGSQFMAPENVLGNFKCGSSHPFRSGYSEVVATGGNDGVLWW